MARQGHRFFAFEKPAFPEWGFSPAEGKARWLGEKVSSLPRFFEYSALSLAVYFGKIVGADPDNYFNCRLTHCLSCNN